MVEQLGGEMSRSKIKLMQDGKYIRRLLTVGKICGVSIVDYGKRSNNSLSKRSLIFGTSWLRK